MKKITPNIAVENCGQAVETYRQIFGGEIKNENRPRTARSCIPNCM